MPPRSERTKRTIPAVAASLSSIASGYFAFALRGCGGRRVPFGGGDAPLSAACAAAGAAVVVAAAAAASLSGERRRRRALGADGGGGGRGGGGGEEGGGGSEVSRRGDSDGDVGGESEGGGNAAVGGDHRGVPSGEGLTTPLLSPSDGDRGEDEERQGGDYAPPPSNNRGLKRVDAFAKSFAINNDLSSLSSSSSSEMESVDQMATCSLDLEEAKRLAQADHAVALWREGIFIFAYLILTVLSFTLGVEAVDLGKNADPVVRIDVIYIAASLVTLQMSYFFFKSTLTAAQTSPRTFLDLRAAHVHPIRFVVERYDAYCDICSESILHGECFRCQLCDFDFCVDCFKKGRKSQDWAVLRGDKGPKVLDGAVRRAGTMSYLLRSMGLLQPYWPYVILTGACLLVNVVFRLFIPNVEGRLFDHLIEGSVSSFLSGVKVLAAYWAGQTLFQSVQRYSTRKISRRLRIDLRKRLFERLLSQDIAFFDSTRAGAMARRVDGDVEDMSYPIPMLVNRVLQSMVLIVGALTCCLLTSLRLTVLSAACIGPVAYLTYLSAEWGGNLEGQMVACEEEGSAITTEAVNNIRNVRAFSAEGIEIERYDKVLSRLQRKMQREAVGQLLVEVLEGSLENLTEVLVLAFGGIAIVTEHIDAPSIGQLIAFTMYWDILRDGIESIQDVFSDLAQAAGAAQRVFDLLEIEPDIPLKEGLALSRQNFRGQIQFDGVHFAYQSRPDRKVLNDFDLEVPAGSTVALVGRSGAGKTTLVHLLQRFYDPQSGQIIIDGIPLTDLNLKSFHDVIGFVSQETKLNFGTVRDNLTYGLDREVTDEEIDNATEAANCKEFIDELEEGYDTSIGEGGLKLSGGQRQRLAIARAFLRRPRLLILDEATSHLDMDNEILVQAGIDRLVKSVSDSRSMVEGERQITGQCTVIVIAHRLSTVRNADVIVVVHEGRVAEQGSHESLMQINGFYAKLVTKQTERESNMLLEEQVVEHVCSDIDSLFDKVIGRKDSSSSGSDSGCESE